MRHNLIHHPDSRCDAVASLTVEVTREGGKLSLDYLLTGEIGALRIPARSAPRRTDELWRHTCFEAFVRASGVESYVELNFAPSTAWAAYRFSGYRQGMAPLASADPTIEASARPKELRLRASADLVGSVPPEEAWNLGLTAVIEEMNGRISYWALTHPQGKPDFHHPDGFSLELAYARRT